MAEGKKSFIVYTSWNNFLEELSNEQLGLTFRWMLEYCNDKNPDYPTDVAVKMAIKVIQPILKTDLKKYESKVKSVNRAREVRKNNIEIKNDNNIENNTEINTDINQCNMLNDKCNMLYEVSKDTNNNILSISKDISNITSEPKILALELPTIKGKNGTKFPIYQDQIDSWQEIYVGVNVTIELKKMLAWLEANPKNIKTYQGTPRFIVNWLSKQQDRAARNGYAEVKPTDIDDNGGFEVL